MGRPCVRLGRSRSWFMGLALAANVVAREVVVYGERVRPSFCPAAAHYSCGVRCAANRNQSQRSWFVGGRGRRAGLRSQKVMTGNGLWGTAGHGLWGRRERSWFVGRIRASNSFRLKQRSWPMGTPPLCAIGHGLWGRPHARAKVMVCGALKWSWFVGKI